MDRDYCTSTPDQAGLRRYRRRVTDGLRIEGVFCTGVMGEFWTLMKEERKRVVKIVVEEARGDCKVRITRSTRLWN